MNTTKKNVVFVGAFNTQEDGSTGGQAYACQSIVDSDISKYVNWIKIDTTADSVMHVGFVKRLTKAFLRLMKFSRAIAKKENTAAIIFTAHAFSFYEKGLMVIIASLFGKRTILCPRSGFIIDDLKSSFKRKYFRYVFKKSSFVICQGASWKKLFEEVLPNQSSKFIVVKNWVNLAQYKINKKAHNDKLQILYLAWVDKQKGIFDLLAALKLLKDLKKIEVNICGEGADFIAAKEWVISQKMEQQVIFHGWVKGSKKLDLLAAADIFVLPSYAEGLPNALLEAMIAETAVISSRVGSVPDVIIEGKNGLMFKAGDVDELTHCLQTLINDSELRVCLSKAAIETIEREHNLEQAQIQFKTVLLQAGLH